MGGILVVDDDQHVAKIIARILNRHGLRVRFAYSGGDCMRELGRQRPDLVLLDLGLPDGDGMATLEQLREVCSVPVIVVTGRHDRSTRINGLDAGADDFIAKPFDGDELAARVRSVLRRTSDPAKSHNGLVRYNDLTFDRRNQLILDEQNFAVELTEIESSLLTLLLEQSPHPLSRQRIYPLLFGREWLPGERSIDVHAYRLRNKIRQLSTAGVDIVSVRNVGYKIELRSMARPH